jgi:hypothetical protein
MHLFSEKLFELFHKPSGLFFHDPMSAVVDHAPLYRLSEALKLFEGPDAHRMISANSPHRHSQSSIRKLDEVRCFSSDRPIDTQCAPQTVRGREMMGILIQISFPECIPLVLIGSNKFC